jgi:hypothetical protein
LLAEFDPKRIRDTPLLESGFTGAGIGAAMAGMRPIVELMARLGVVAEPAGHSMGAAGDLFRRHEHPGDHREKGGPTRRMREVDS